MLTLENVTIALDSFRLSADISVPSGSRTVILGPSGAGKSTLLGAIAGLTPCTGCIKWQGEDISHLPAGERPIAVLFQDNNLFPHLTAQQNVGLGLDPGLKLDPAQKAVVQQALAATGLAGLEKRKPSELSGGQQSRVALARILVQNRPLVLLDEPFSALGPGLRREMLERVDALSSTVVMVSHNVEDAKSFASHIIWLDDSRAENARPTDAFFADPPAELASYI